jgi:hypothetical protein
VNVDLAGPAAFQHSSENLLGLAGRQGLAPAAVAGLDMPLRDLVDLYPASG